MRGQAVAKAVRLPLRLVEVAVVAVEVFGVLVFLVVFDGGFTGVATADTALSKSSEATGIGITGASVGVVVGRAPALFIRNNR